MAANMVDVKVRAGRVPLEEMVLLRRRRGQELEYRGGDPVVSHFESTNVERLTARNGVRKLLRNRKKA